MGHQAGNGGGYWNSYWASALYRDTELYQSESIFELGKFAPPRGKKTVSVNLWTNQTWSVTFLVKIRLAARVDAKPGFWNFLRPAEQQRGYKCWVPQLLSHILDLFD